MVLNSMVFLLLFLCHISSSVGQLPKEELIEFGVDNGDEIFFSNDDNTTTVRIPVKFPFYDRLYQIVYVS